MYVHAYVQTYVCTYMHMYVHAYVHTNMIMVKNCEVFIFQRKCIFLEKSTHMWVTLRVGLEIWKRVSLGYYEYRV